jgi:hypothetical protein
MEEYSLVPNQYKKKDPRSLLYHFPSLPIVKYAKLMQQFSFYQALEVAEDLANRQGYILLPWSCIHWQRAKQYSNDRKIKIGRNSFFMMQPSELTKTEESKLQHYIEETRDKKEKIS